MLYKVQQPYLPSSENGRCLWQLFVLFFVEITYVF
jgi:hypothetical protein